MNRQLSPADHGSAGLSADWSVVRRRRTELLEDLLQLSGAEQTSLDVIPVGVGHLEQARGDALDGQRTTGQSDDVPVVHSAAPSVSASSLSAAFSSSPASRRSAAPVSYSPSICTSTNTGPRTAVESSPGCRSWSCTTAT